jgi:hypothetical protein
MTGTNIIEIKVTNGTSITGGTKGGSGGTGGGMLGASTGLAKLIGLTQIMHELLKELLWAFKPVINILKGIARTLGTFLEPIASLLFLLIKPLLDFIRPLAMIFRAMMAPVMGLLRQFSAVMSHQMASGDTSGAMSTGLDMITLGLSGFFIAFANVAGNLLISAIGGILETMTTGLIDFIVLMMVPITSMIDRIFRTDLTGALLDSAESLKTDVSLAFQEGISYAQGALTECTQTMMNGLVEIYTNKLTSLQETVETNLPLAVDPLEETLPNTLASVGTAVGTLQTDTNTALTTMNEDITTYMNTTTTGSIPVMFSDGLKYMEDSVNSFATAAVLAGKKISSALRSAEKAKKSTIQIGLINIS